MSLPRSCTRRVRMLTHVPFFFLVGIGRPMTRAARSYAPRVYAQPGKQPNFQDLPKMALGGMAAAKGIGLASVAHAADIQQVYR